MRSIDDVTDDVLVGAVAKYGIDGVPVGRLGMMAVGLGLSTDVKSDLEERLNDLYHQTDRICRPRRDVYALTADEWGRRLTGKSAEKIARELMGG